MKKFANYPIRWWLFLGVTSTVVLLIRLFDMERYTSDIVLIPFIVGAVLGYGVALAIVIARKVQNDRIRKEQSESEPSKIPAESSSLPGFLTDVVVSRSDNLKCTATAWPASHQSLPCGGDSFLSRGSLCGRSQIAPTNTSHSTL